MDEKKQDRAKILYAIAQRYNYYKINDKEKRMFNKELAYCIYIYIIDNFTSIPENKYSKQQIDGLETTYPNLYKTISDSVKKELEIIIENPDGYKFLYSSNNQTNSFESNNIKKLNNNNNINFKYSYEENKSIFMDPSNEIWLNILLYGTLILEVLAFFTIIFFAVESESVLTFFGGVIGLIWVHFLLMLSLNKAFNIQSIKKDINEIKNEFLSKNKE